MFNSLIHVACNPCIRVSLVHVRKSWCLLRTSTHCVIMQKLELVVSPKRIIRNSSLILRCRICNSCCVFHHYRISLNGNLLKCSQSPTCARIRSRTSWVNRVLSNLKMLTKILILYFWYAKITQKHIQYGLLDCQAWDTTETTQDCDSIWSLPLWCLSTWALRKPSW